MTDIYETETERVGTYYIYILAKENFSRWQEYFNVHVCVWSTENVNDRYVYGQSKNKLITDMCIVKAKP